MESVLLAETYVPKEELITIARAVLLAQNIREDSWDAAAKKYKKDDQVAANEAVEQYKLNDVWKNVIYRWNTRMWNDIQGWAECIILEDSNERAL